MNCDTGGLTREFLGVANSRVDRVGVKINGYVIRGSRINHCESAAHRVPKACELSNCQVREGNGTHEIDVDVEGASVPARFCFS